MTYTSLKMETVWCLNPPSESLFKEGRCQQKSDFYQTNYPPLTLAYIASILRDNYKIRILDGTLKSLTEKEILERYPHDKPSIVFVNTTTPTYEKDMAFAEKLQKKNKTKIVVFGIHASFFRHEHFIHIKDPLEYAYSIINKKKPSLEDLPLPAWDMINTKEYILPLKREPFLLLQASIGCPFECTFCTARYFSPIIQKRTVDSVIKEIKYIKSLGINNIIFMSDTFTMDKKWTRELCQKIIEGKINMGFCANSRVDTIDEKTARVMKSAGFWLISLGIESGNQDILDMAKKGTNLKQIRKSVRVIRNAGILILGHFILGLPGETEKTLRATLNFSKELPLDFAMFYIATPFPGSELYKLHDKKERWEKYEYSSNIISDLDLEKWQEQAYKEFYLTRKVDRIKRIIKTCGLRKIPAITNTALNFGKIYLEKWRK